MRFSLAVEVEGREEPIIVQIDSRDIRKWEASFGGSWLSDDVMTVTQMAQVAWAAAVRTGQWEGDYDSFDAVAVTLKRIEVEQVNPTQTALGVEP